VNGDEMNGDEANGDGVNGDDVPASCHTSYPSISCMTQRLGQKLPIDLWRADTAATVGRTPSHSIGSSLQSGQGIKTCATYATMRSQTIFDSL
jgi:hypothetical protein